MAAPFDRTPYTTAPAGTVPEMIGLAAALLAARPKAATAGVREAARDLRSAARALESVHKARRTAAGGPTDARPVDTEVDHAWSWAFDRIESLAMLPIEVSPRVARARALREKLFPDSDLSFLSIAFQAEWAEIQWRMEMIDQEGLAAEIDALAGPEFLAHIRETFVRYGEVLGTTKPREPEGADPVDLQEPRRALGQAIVDYNYQVLSLLSARRPETVAVVRAAFRPIDEFRARASRSGGNSAPGEPEGVATGDAPGTPVKAPVK